MHGFRLPEKSKLRRKVQITEFEPSQVDIERQHETEIKNIVERHIKTRQPLPTGQLNFSDLTTIPTNLQERLQAVQNGQEAWAQLPNDVKRQYQTPTEFLHALQSTDERENLENLGIFIKQTKTLETPVSKSQGEPA